MMPRRQGSRLIILACLVALPLSTPACGFIFAHGPPPNHESLNYFYCTESNVAPALDIVWGALNFVGAIAVASDPDSYELEYGQDAGAAVAISIGWMGVSTAGAITGFNKTARCREAKRLLAERQGQPGAAAGAAVTAVVVAPSVDTLTVGEQVQLTATAYQSSGAAVSDRVFMWSSSNDAIASVSNVGLVTAHAAGAVIVAARTDNVTGTARVFVMTRD